jgi:hypothetical protein
MSRKRSRAFVLTSISSALAVCITACGSSHSSSNQTTIRAAATHAATATAAPAPRAPAPRLRIVSPRDGARAGQTLTVRVSLTGLAATGTEAFKYVLDGIETRLGTAQLTFHGLAPGQHHLLVALVARPSVNGSLSFSVPAPALAPSSVPTPIVSAPAAPTTMTPPSAPAPRTPTPSATPPASTPTPPTSSATPPPTTTTQAPIPAPTPMSAIPQGPNAGDGDNDNHGGPSDGDGNI